MVKHIIIWTLKDSLSAEEKNILIFHFTACFT